jgi:hypothetical protein
MGSFKRPRAFDPLDLEIIDRVYEAAWAQIEAREPWRDTERDAEREQGLRKLIFGAANKRPVDFDDLYERTIKALGPTEVKVVCPQSVEDLSQSSTD